MSYKLFLDDERKCPEGWVFAYSYSSFVAIITERGVPDVIAFDHDLGEEWDEEGLKVILPTMNGYDCAKWLIANSLIPKEFSVHSFNFHGADRIKYLLEENGSKLIGSPAPYINS